MVGKEKKNGWKALQFSQPDRVLFHAFILKCVSACLPGLLYSFGKPKFLFLEVLFYLYTSDVTILNMHHSQLLSDFQFFIKCFTFPCLFFLDFFSAVTTVYQAPLVKCFFTQNTLTISFRIFFF